jgi:hypothetical protein
MLGRGDWKKLEDAINGVTVPLGERVSNLESALEELKAAVEALKGSDKTKRAPKAA